MKNPSDYSVGEQGGGGRGCKISDPSHFTWDWMIAFIFYGKHIHHILSLVL